MKKNRILIITLFCLALTIGGYAQQAFNSISIEQIKNSLPPRPVAVGFDVDDTVLFSAPGFYYGFENKDGENGTNRYGKRVLGSMEFWRDMNGHFDNFSIPKQSARDVIEMHKARGDKIYFITARPWTKDEILTKIVHREFKLDNKYPVIFSGRTSKAVYIRNKNIRLFYGDSDSDISEAHHAGVRAIRFMRSPLSNNKGKYHPGKHGESVLENSEN